MRAYWHSPWSRMKGLLRRRALEREMAEELALHLEELTQANLASGMDPEDARLAAQRRFGGVAQIEERCRDERGFAWPEQFCGDLRFAVRSLCGARTFTAIVLVTLVLGLGALTGVFELTERKIFRSSPFPRAEQLYFVGYRDKQNLSSYFHAGFYFQAFQQQTNVFSEYAAAGGEDCNVVADGHSGVASVLNVSADCFRTLGVKPALGRPFLPGEFQPGSRDVVVVSDLFWRKSLHASPNALGRKVLVDQQPCVIVGILGRNQAFPANFAGDLYRPLAFKYDPAHLFEPSLSVIGRLRPGVTREQAVAALSAVGLPTLPPWASAYFADQALTLTSLREMDRAEIYWVLFAAALILFAIACLNAVNLMAIRLMTRRRELCIRFAIGAARRKILQLILVESLVLSLAAGLLVAIAARWIFPGFLAALNGSDEALYQSPWDARTLSFIGGLGALTCIAMMIAPAARLRRDDFHLGLKEGGAGSGGSRRGGRIGLALIVLQAACAVVLLTASGLMVRSFQRVHQVDLGFDPAGKVKVWVLFPHGYEPKPEARLQLFERLKRRLRFVPGVEAVSYAQDSILEGGIWGTAQLQMADGSFQPTAGNYISADYLQTAGLTMKRGRWLSNEPGRVEVVINETLARARFGDEDPIGNFIKIQITGDRPFPVVGVVKNVRETLRSPAGMRFYSQAWQYPPNINTLVLRLAQDPGPGFADAVRQAIREVDPNLIASDIRSIDQLVTDLMWTENYAYRILKGLAAIALGLTVVGLFSVITYSVGSRMNEFGVRLAVGAKPLDLGRLVMGRGLAAAGIGLAAGLAGAFGLTRFMAGLLFETAPFDLQVYLVVIAVLMAAAAMACWMPARRAARLDVVRLLRSD